MIPIIFTHYGDADYLARTLTAASLSNPDRLRILIGDGANIAIAQAAGWEHIDMGTISSVLLDEFRRHFREVQGAKHRAFKGGRNWLQYVFERWYLVQALIETREIPEFWHFDSDVMLVAPLDRFEAILREEGRAFTRQCNDTCLNGYVTAPVVNRFCRYIIELFQDDAVLAGYQRQYDQGRPGDAFTEMTAFKLLSHNEIGACGCHLEGHFPGWWFDDALAQPDGFVTGRLGFLGPDVKAVRFDGAHFTANRHGEILKFASMNCSWLPLSVFDWILSCQRGQASGRLADAVPFDAVMEWGGAKQRLKALLKAR